MQKDTSLCGTVFSMLDRSTCFSVYHRQACSSDTNSALPGNLPLYAAFTANWQQEEPTRASSSESPAPCRTQAPSSESPVPCRTQTPSSESPAPCRTLAPSSESPAPCRTLAPSSESPAPCRTRAPSSESPAPCRTLASSSESPAPCRTQWYVRVCYSLPNFKSIHCILWRQHTATLRC